jgi:hypothetical protein
MKKNSKAANTCCKDEQKEVKLDKHNRAGNTNLQPAKPACPIIHATDYGFNEITRLPIIEYETSRNSTTEHIPNSLYLRYCVFRI